jgi:hypothetical protein
MLSNAQKTSACHWSYLDKPLHQLAFADAFTRLRQWERDDRAAAAAPFRYMLHCTSMQALASDVETCALETCGSS